MDGEGTDAAPKRAKSSELERLGVVNEAGGGANSAAAAVAGSVVVAVVDANGTVAFWLGGGRTCSNSGAGTEDGSNTASGGDDADADGGGRTANVVVGVGVNACGKGPPGTDPLGAGGAADRYGRCECMGKDAVGISSCSILRCWKGTVGDGAVSSFSNSSSSPSPSSASSSPSKP